MRELLRIQEEVDETRHSPSPEVYPVYGLGPTSPDFLDSAAHPAPECLPAWSPVTLHWVYPRDGFNHHIHVRDRTLSNPHICVGRSCGLGVGVATTASLIDV